MDLTNQMSSREDVLMEENTLGEARRTLFSAFDFTTEDVDAALDKEKKSLVKSKSICICGHADGFHGFSENQGADYCSANKSNCACKKKQLVITAQDTRSFLRKTTGPGADHALARGIRDAEAAGQVLEWIGEPTCEPCGSTVDLSPCPVSERGIILYEDKGFNAFLCVNCRSTR